jgi:polyhydroxyalkanoate synthesis regulator phasin
MPDTFNTLLKLGLGTMVLTRERAKKLVDELARQGEVSKVDAQKLLKELVKKGEQSEKVMRREILGLIEKIMKKFDVPSRKEIKELKAEIAALKKSRKKRSAKK